MTPETLRGMEIGGTVVVLIGIIFWYRGMIRKSYAAERDFGHLKRHYEGLALGQEAMLKELDTRCDAIERQLIRIEAAIASRNN